MPSFSAIKQEAKRCLKNNWPISFAIGFLIIAVEMLLLAFNGFVSLLFTTVDPVDATVIAFVCTLAAFIFLACPMLLGAIRWFWFTSGNYQVAAREVFHYFSRTDEYCKATSLGLKLLGRLVLAGIICYLPAIIIHLLSQPKLYAYFGFQMPYWFASIWMLENVLAIGGSFFLVFIMTRYAIAPVLVINDNSLSTREALHLSTVVLRLDVWHCVGFMLSFILWILLGLLIIPRLYTTPYFLCSYAIFARYTIQQYNRNAQLRN